MGDSLISIGDKIELKQFENRPKKDDNSEDDIRIYKSQVLDILDENIIQGAMPIYEGHLVPLELGSKYDACFQTSKGLYRAIVEVTARSKVEKIYIVELKLISEPERFQRREYFRLSTNIEMSLVAMTETEFRQFMVTKVLPDSFANDKYSGVATDISGGGTRIITKVQYNKGMVIVLDFDIANDSGFNHVEILAKVVSCEKNQNKPELNEVRVQFKWVSNSIRENLVKYIHDEQRKLIQKERGR